MCMSFLAELKRRNVFRVGIAYAVAAWVLLQVLDVVGEILELPTWGGKLILIIIVVGFFVTLFVAWAFELTPEGIKHESEVDRSQSIMTQTGRKLDRVIIGFLVLAVVILLGDRFIRVPTNPKSHTTDEQASQQSAEEDLEGARNSSVMPYFDTDKSLSTIGEELGADFVVEGSVRRIDDHVRIIVQLIEANSDRHLWANNFDRELQDELAAQSAVAGEIARSIQRELLPDSVGAISGLPTDSVKAYDLYTRAQNIARSEIESESTFRRQRELLEQAVAEDPEFVEAWGMLNEVLDHSIRSLLMRGWFVSEGGDQEAMQNELAAASKHSLERAASLDPDNFWTLMARHHDPLEEYRPEFNAESRVLVDRMVREYPEQALGWLALGWSYHYEGDIESADSAFQKAIDLDPFHAGVVYSSLFHFRNTGNQEMVNVLFDRLAKIAPQEGTNTRLSEAGVDTRLINLVQAFWQTSDERLIDRHGEILFDPDARFVSPVSELNNEFNHWAMRNDPDRILALKDRLELSMPAVFMDLLNFNMLAGSMATIHFERGEQESAGSLARKILATESIPQANFPGTIVGNYAAYSHACALLDNYDCARRWAEKALEKARDTVFWDQFNAYMAVSRVDLNRAVQLILREKTRDPRWLGTDIIATFQIVNRHLLRHPDMIDFYQQEGKWIDYLSKSMPEYEED